MHLRYLDAMKYRITKMHNILTYLLASKDFYEVDFRDLWAFTIIMCSKIVP